MKATEVSLAIILCVLTACSAHDEPIHKARPSDIARSCVERFRNGTVEKMLDRWVQFERQGTLVGIQLSYKLEFDDRPAKEFERLLGMIAPSEQLTVSFDKGRWLVEVDQSNVLIRTGSALSDRLKRTCALAAQERMDLVGWQYKLPDDVHLETGTLYFPPVP